MLTSLTSRARRRATRRSLLQRLLGNESGIAAVEFAYVFPVMLIAFLGMADVAIGVMMQRKASMLNRTVADLASQMQSIDNIGRDSVFNASLAVMAPYNNRPTGMSFASIVVDPTGTARVCWVEASGMAAPYSVGQVITLPADMRVPRTSFIVAQSNVTYTPAVGYVISGTFSLGRTPIYMRPRQAVVGGPNGIEQVERTGRAMC